MKKHLIVLAAMAALAVGVSALPAAAASTGNVNILLGQKTLDDNDWEPIEKQPAFGILVDFRMEDWPVNIAVDLLGSKDDDTISGTDVEGSTTEIDLGVRWIYEELGQIKPYVGGGLALLSAEVKADAGPVSVSDDDSTVGFWLNGGVYYTFAEHFNVGLDLRYSQGDVDLMGTSADAGGFTAGLLLGYHW